jgi:hypothetical protein
VFLNPKHSKEIHIESLLSNLTKVNPFACMCPKVFVFPLMSNQHFWEPRHLDKFMSDEYIKDVTTNIHISVDCRSGKIISQLVGFEPKTSNST